jgi:hypothetical protein
MNQQHYRHTTDIVGWIIDNEPVCLDCKPTTPEEEKRYEALQEIKKHERRLTTQEQAFIDKIDARANPLFDGEISQYWAVEDHRLVCSKCGEEIEEADEEYTRLYQIFEQKIVGYRDAQDKLFCISDTGPYTGARKPLTPLHYGDQGTSGVLLENTPCSYEHCYLDTIIEEFNYELKQFANTWDFHLKILRYYHQIGLLEDLEARR